VILVVAEELVAEVQKDVGDARETAVGRTIGAEGEVVVDECFVEVGTQRRPGGLLHCMPEGCTVLTR
jgi:hypothetical protein